VRPRPSPRIKRILPGGVPLRETRPSEEDFFRSRPDIAGMATDDGAVVLNPYSPLSEQEMDAVALNEAARVIMSTRMDLRPSFALTPEQEAAFASYGPLECVKATVAARILSGDPSALTPTAEQIAFVLRLAREMGIPADAVRLATRARAR
jgi:hypothetical protein